MPSTDPLDRQLDAWQPDLEPDPSLKQHVMQRIAWEEEAQSRPWHRRTSTIETLWRPLAAAGVAACLLLLIGTWAGRNWFDPANPHRIEDNRQAYLLLIDPVSRAKATRDPVAQVEQTSPGLITMLAWMQDRFDLDREQFLELVSLHETYQTQFEDLYLELKSVQDDYASFEARRAANEMIDFIALYDLLQKRKALEADARATSSELVEKVIALLDPDQAAAYLAAIEAAANQTDA